MNTNLISKINNIDAKIHELSKKADYLNKLAKSAIENYNYFKQAAVAYDELANTYKEYISIVEKINSPKNLLLLKANMYHEKYDCNYSYGCYYEIIQEFQKASSYYKVAENYSKNAIDYIKKLFDMSLTPNERDVIEYDYNVWSLDSMLIKASLISNESHIAQKNGDYALACDKTKELIDISQEIYNTTLTKTQYFSYEDRRKYQAQIEALHANIFSINHLQSAKYFYLTHSPNAFLDMILFLTKSYEYTEKAIQINNFWSDYKTVRDNICNNLSILLHSNKKIWLTVLEKSNHNPLLIGLMINIAPKYYKKITNTGGLFKMNIFKNIVKTKESVIINNGNNNNTTLSQPNMLLSISDTNKLMSLIDYLKNTPCNNFTSQEYIDTIGKLNAILSAKTHEQQENALKD